MPAEQGFDVSLAELIDEKGYVHLPHGFSGSIDPAGFRMISKQGNMPRFARTGNSPNHRWSESRFGLPGCDGQIQAALAINGEIFLGGRFQICGLAAVSNVARYTPGVREFSALGDGVNGSVLALVAIGTDLYVGGAFSSAGGAPANGIAKFDTSQTDNSGWSILGDGVGGQNGSVGALAAIGTDLFIGGSFNSAGAASANSIAKFDTTQTGNSGWSALGDGLTGMFFSFAQVSALTAIGADLFVGGDFVSVGGAPASRIAKFDTTQTGNSGWSALGDGVNGAVRALSAIGADLYVGGQFTQAGGSPANNVAKFDTTQNGASGWSPLGGGVNSTVSDLAAIDTNLYVGGSFSQAGAEGASAIARFDTTQTGNSGWSALSEGVSGGPVASTRAMTAVGNELYVGGIFTEAGGSPANNVAKFDTMQTGNSGWSALGDGVNSTVSALAAIGTDLYVGGSFSQAGTEEASAIAKIDTTQTGNSGWSTLGDGVNGPLLALSAIGTDLYVGGEFSQAGGLPASNVAKFDTTQTGNSGWSALGDGVNGTVWALSAIGTDLYVGGEFTQAGGSPANNVAKLDATQIGNISWSALGDGVNGGSFASARALTAIGNELYVGGRFTQAGGSPANNVAKFDTTQTGNSGWSALGDGVNSTVSVLAAIDTNLYVGGFFSQAAAEGASAIAKFDTTQTDNGGWSPLGDGLSGGGAALRGVFTLLATGTDLYVGGQFGQAGGSPTNNVAKFDTTQTGNSGWSALGEGVNGPVRALAAVGADLYVGGQFSQAGSNPNGNFAQYETASDRDALTALYNSTNGVNWANNTGWLGPEGTECSWFGVRCSNGSVTEIVLEENGLSGLIPPEIGQLRNLRFLWLAKNQLTGPIPSELSQVIALETLNLNFNGLTGLIPTEFSQLSSLTNLSLGWNQLTGPIPAELAQLSLLQSLGLGGNDLTGSIPPELGQLSNLTTGLFLWGNQLTGSIPPELGQLPGPIFINLQANLLTGSIPPELGGLGDIEGLYLDRNQLAGPIPPELGQLTNATQINLERNNLSGPVPMELGNLDTNLEFLGLAQNPSLTGTVPQPLLDRQAQGLLTITFDGTGVIGCEAQRVLPDGYVPGTPLTVTIQTQPATGTGSYAIEDVPPSTWTVNNVQGGTFDSANGTVKFGPYFDAQARTLTYDLTPPVNATGNFTFSGTFSKDGTSAGLCGQDLIGPSQADLNVTKVASVSTASPGEQFSYTLTVNNTGPNPAQGVLLTDTLPSDLNFVSASADCTGTGTIECSAGDLAPGAVASFTVQVEVSDTAPAGPVDNTVAVGSATLDPNTGNDVATATVELETLSALNLVINQIDASSCPDMSALVTVTDQFGQSLGGLTGSNFTLAEDGQSLPFSLSTVSTGSSSRLAVSIVIDRSTSLSNADLMNMQSAANDFIGLLANDDEVAIWQFNGNIDRLQDFTTDKALASGAVNSITLQGSTAIYDAVADAAAYSQTATGRKAIVLFTDGRDNRSSRSKAQAIDAAIAAGTPVFTIGFGNADPNVLDSIATQSGGLAFQDATSANLGA
ncbi:VWA domain-containing protein, partial [Wenzhouxiangella limi]